MVPYSFALGAVKLGTKGNFWVAQVAVIQGDGISAKPHSRCLHLHRSEQRAEVCAERLSNIPTKELASMTVLENSRVRAKPMGTYKQPLNQS